MGTIKSPPAPALSATRNGTPTWIMPRHRLLRWGMRTLGAIRPSYAAKVMDQLWFSAPRSRPRPIEQATLDAGRRMSWDVHGSRITAWVWGNKGPTILLMHGWGGHSGQMHAFVEPLRVAGFRIIAFDAPAHGASDASRYGGRRVTFFEFADALQAVASHEHTLAGIVAHSGGCIAVSLALRAGWKAPADLVFIAPFVQPAAAIPDFAKVIGANDRVAAEFSAGAERWLGHPWSYLDITTLGDAYKQQRLLVVHDEDDCEVPLSRARAVATTWPSSKLLVTRGLGHRRLLRDSGVVEAALNFLADSALAPIKESDGYRPRDSRATLDAAYEDFISDAWATRRKEPSRATTLW
jgi:pimeloyl-ACP methyl ester carboxylesterase